jgi:hypothetical protein
MPEGEGKRVKIIQISESDRGGGAERIASDLHRMSLAAGHDSRLVVGYKRSDDPTDTGLVPENGPTRFAYRSLRFLERRSGVQARLYWMAASWSRRILEGGEVVQLHNVL